jgi:hypothetical protein
MAVINQADDIRLGVQDPGSVHAASYRVWPKPPPYHYTTAGNRIRSNHTDDLTVDGDVRFTALVRDESIEAASTRMINTKQNDAGTQYSWRFGATYGTALNVLGYPTTANAPQITVLATLRSALGLTPPGVDRYVGHIITGVKPTASLMTCRGQAIGSVDGNTWTNIGALSAAVRGDALMAHSPLAIMQLGWGWEGRIYWQQLQAINRAQLWFPLGGTYQYLSCPTVTLPRGDQTIIWKQQIPVWPPGGANYPIVSVGNQGATQGPMQPYFSPTGGLSVYVSPDGIQANRLNLGMPINAYVANTVGWFAITMDVDNGAGGFTMRVFQSTDGRTWVKSGADVVRTPAITQFPAVSAFMQIPGNTQWGGRIGAYSIRDGIAADGSPGGTPVFEVNENDAGTLATATTFVATTGQTVTLNPVANTIAQKQPDKLIWRFDAREWTVGATTFIDPRGRTWTATTDPVVRPSSVPDAQVIPGT